MISLIVAHSNNYCIGKDGWMPWNIPEDLKHFKEKTLNHKILMGRTTFEAMKKPLPNRFSYVLTNNKDYNYEHENVKVIHDINQIKEEFMNSEDTLIICGGAKIYEQFIDVVDEMWISLIDGNYEGDTFFPSNYEGDFNIISEEKKEGFTIIHYKK